MNGYLIGEQGPQEGLIVALEPKGLDQDSAESNQWIVGRNPEDSDITLEDPMVSRKHVVLWFSEGGFFIENLSSVNPAEKNGDPLTEPSPLNEGDKIQIGSTLYAFTLTQPQTSPAQENTPLEPDDLLEQLSQEEDGAEQSPSDEPSETTDEQPPSPEEDPLALFDAHHDPSLPKWLLKVISGPNAGAELAMPPGSTYIIGKDAHMCDIVFQDSSVSRQHARLQVQEQGDVIIEDLESRNGTFVNGERLEEGQRSALSQDVITLGTTSFLLIDREAERLTVVAASTPSARSSKQASVDEEKDTADSPQATQKDWKNLVIPQRHLVLAGIVCMLIFGCVLATITLFYSRPIPVAKINPEEQFRKAFKDFQEVHYTFNKNSGKLFLAGHVLSVVDHKSLMYLLENLSFVYEIQDNVVIDELVWQNMNALLQNNPSWTSLSLYSRVPGQFILRGYLSNEEQLEQLRDHMNANFPFLTRLKFDVFVERAIDNDITQILTSHRIQGVSFQINNGEVTLSGTLAKKQQPIFQDAIAKIQSVPGVHHIRNFVQSGKGQISAIDVSQRYPVSGYSKGADGEFFVLINGKILGDKEILDGMQITKITEKQVLLEQDGTLYEINYAFDFN